MPDTERCSVLDMVHLVNQLFDSRPWRDVKTDVSNRRDNFPHTAKRNIENTSPLVPLLRRHLGAPKAKMTCSSYRFA
jgi:hypothetical protein